MTAADMPAVLAIDQACFGGLWTASGYQREIDSPNSDLLLLEAGEAKTATTTDVVGVGCLWSILEEAHITLLGIIPTHRRQGLGRWLLLHLLQAARDRALTHATLEVRATNQAAQDLYHDYGFKVAGRRRHYYADGEDALILWRGSLQAPQFQHHLGLWQQAAATTLQQHGWCPQSRT